MSESGDSVVRIAERRDHVGKEPLDELRRVGVAAAVRRRRVALTAGDVAGGDELGAPCSVGGLSAEQGRGHERGCDRPAPRR